MKKSEGIKQKEKKGGKKKRKRTDSSVVIAKRGRGVREVEVGRGGINGDRKRRDFCW